MSVPTRTTCGMRPLVVLYLVKEVENATNWSLLRRLTIDAPPGTAL